jgi:hypothetical protein
MPEGILFIWIEKEYILKVLRALQNRFEYVENLAWVRRNVNNRILTQDYKYFRKAKLSLLLFKRVWRFLVSHNRYQKRRNWNFGTREALM